jgi:AcrR family transcriptional regulator
MEPQERILQKAHELFMLYGIRSVSMDEIAAHLGISKKTIYQYYADKDALVDAVVSIELDCNESECELQRSQSENSIHEVFLAVDMVRELLSKMNPSFIYELEKYHPKAFKKFNDYKHKFLYDVLTDNLNRGKADGIYREEINVEIMARYRLASMFFIFNPEMFPHHKYNPWQILAEITDNFLWGLATVKGQKLIQKYKQLREK